MRIRVIVFASVSILLLLFGSNLWAQTSGISALDGLTPQGLQPGSPAGSYALSDLDTINLYNGSANIVVPLLQISGRGESGYTIVAKYDSHWEGVGFVNEYPCSPVPCWAFNNSGWANWDYSYRPAGIAVRHIGQGSYAITSNGTVSCTVFQSTLTRLAIGLGDGTEVMLIDATTGGRPQVASSSSCAIQGLDRGNVFVATDGSAITFVADTHIFDSTTGASVPGDAITGTLYFRDGRRFHFGRFSIAGYMATAIDSIQDRNGNRATFKYSTSTAGFQYGFTVTDSIGRVTSVSVGKQYLFTDDANAGCTASNPCNGVYDQITYPGTAGQLRTILVYRRAHWYDRMSTLQSAPVPTYSALFGGYASTTMPAFVWAISKIVLPDLHSYQFRYNQYAEPVRVDLPTGARYEFDWENGPGANPNQTCPQNPQGVCPIIRAPTFLQPPGGYDQLFAVYRRVKERREYLDGSSAWTRRTTYEPAETASDTIVAGDPLNMCGTALQPSFISGSCTKVSLKEYDSQTQLTNEDHYFYGAVSKYQTLFPQSGWYSWGLEGKQFRRDFMQPTGVLLKKGLDTWLGRYTPSWWSSGIGPQPYFDPHVGNTDTVISNGKMARKAISFSPIENTNNPIDTWEYDYGDVNGSLGPMRRHTHLDYLTSYNNPTGGVYLRDLVQSEKIYDAAEKLAAETDYFYDETPTIDNLGIIQYVPPGTQRGNRTRVRRWRNTDAAWLVTMFSYDSAGNVIATINPRGYAKTFSYFDCAGTYAFVTRMTNEAGQASSAEHDCALGYPTSLTDPNQFQTFAFYAGVADGGIPDPLDRLSKVIRSNGQQITFRYSSDLKSVTTTADQDIPGPNQYTTGDQLLRATTITDGFGRTIETRQYTSFITYVSMKRDIDAFGRVRKSYNPVEMADGQPYTNTNGTTRKYDALGRITAIIYSDGAQETFNWSGDAVLHTDPSGKQDAKSFDALGRLVSVTEDPYGQSITTTYSYDALDDLNQVTQGTQIRSFTYNSLKQLRSSTSPEIGALVSCDGQIVSECYGYDTQPPNDTLKTVTATGVTIAYTYDSLGRLITKSYSDGTPQVVFAYDTTQIGCPYSVANSLARTLFTSYTPDCTLTSSSHTVAGQSYAFSYSYNLTSALTSERYPSGRDVSYHYDPANRPDRIANGNLNSTNNFASNVAYAPHGGIASVRFGATSSNPGWLESWIYNNRLQPVGVNVGAGLLSIGFSYCPNATSMCATNNGNILQQTITRSGTTWVQNYIDSSGNGAYDMANRLTSVQEFAIPGGVPWAETYGYDLYGNRWLASFSGLPTPTAETITSRTAFSSTNRVALWEYSDGRGNITAMPFMQRSFGYDGDNHQTSSTVNGTTTTYSYDGLGQRIKKAVNGATTLYVYDDLGRLVAEYSNQTTGTSGTQYRHIDPVGSTRLMLNASGIPVISGCHDYRPFGQELLAGTNGRTAPCFPVATAGGIGFTGKERDAETGLNVSASRYFSAAQGRFMSPDQVLFDQDPSDPESWNLYSYVRNNPLKYTDPTGRDCIYTNNFDENGTVAVEQGQCTRKHGTFVDGTIDPTTLTYNSQRRSIGYGFNRSDGTVGSGLIGLGQISSSELDSKGLAFAQAMAARVDASNEAIVGFAIGTTIAGAGLGVAPAAGQALNEFAFGPATGRVMFEGASGSVRALEAGVTRLMTTEGLGKLFSDLDLPRPIARLGWAVLSRYWASGAAGAVSMFAMHENEASRMWTTELPALMRNANVIKPLLWR